MGIWEENHSRAAPPWNSETLTRGMEFGVSPFPESRRKMIDRGRLFGVPDIPLDPGADASRGGVLDPGASRRAGP